MIDELSPKDFGRRKKAGTGALAWSPKDVCAHLHAWHRLLLTWYREGQHGQPSMPARGFNWRETPALNRMLYQEFRDVSAASVRRRLKLSHGRVMKLVDGLTDRQLMKPGAFKWTGKLGLISYVSANTDSHYRWATKKIKKLTGT